LNSTILRPHGFLMDVDFVGLEGGNADIRIGVIRAPSTPAATYIVDGTDIRIDHFLGTEFARGATQNTSVFSMYFGAMSNPTDANVHSEKNLPFLKEYQENARVLTRNPRHWAAPEDVDAITVQGTIARFYERAMPEGFTVQSMTDSALEADR